MSMVGNQNSKKEWTAGAARKRIAEVMRSYGDPVRSSVILARMPSIGPKTLWYHLDKMISDMIVKKIDSGGLAPPKYILHEVDNVNKNINQMWRHEPAAYERRWHFHNMSEIML